MSVFKETTNNIIMPPNITVLQHYFNCNNLMCNMKYCYTYIHTYTYTRHYHDLRVIENLYVFVKQFSALFDVTYTRNSQTHTQTHTHH